MRPTDCLSRRRYLPTIKAAAAGAGVDAQRQSNERIQPFGPFSGVPEAGAT